MSKTYTQLAGSSLKISQCSAILPNHMQCWRAGDFQVSITNTEGNETSAYQLCRAHALYERQQDDQLANAEAALVADEAAIAAATPTPAFSPTVVKK